jgi:hypothetical protein
MNCQSCSNTYLYVHLFKVLVFSSTGTCMLVKDNMSPRSLQLLTSHFQLFSMSKTQAFSWQLTVQVMHNVFLIIA